LLYEDYYTDENLLRLVGAPRANWVVHEKDSVRVSFRDIEKEFYIPPSAPGIIPRIICFVDWSKKTSGERRVVIGLSVNSESTDASFDKIVDALGTSWETVPPETATPGRLILPASHPYGNSKLRFIYDDSAVQRSIALETYANGHFSTAMCSGETK
jgi:hypothetical protein